MRVGISGFQPKRLTEIRESRYLSKTALGAIIGRSPSTITKWEDGTHAPDSSTIILLAEKLNCDPGFFIMQARELNNNPIFFRSLNRVFNEYRLSAARYMGWLQEISIKLESFLNYPEVDIPYVNEKNYKLINKQAIDDISKECRTRWGLGSGPLSDLLLIMENAGIICGRFNQGTEAVDAYSQWDYVTDRPYVILSNDKMNYFRSRYDAAHELGHVVLHKTLCQLDNSNHKIIEDQANYFAASFLLPEESFSRDVPFMPTIEDFLTLKRKWGASAQALIKRSYDLDLISDIEYKRFFKQISYKGWRKIEPMDSDILPEKPRFLSRCIDLLLGSNEFSKVQLKNYLGLEQNDIEMLCGLHKGRLSEVDIIRFDEKLKLKDKFIHDYGVTENNLIQFQNYKSY